MAPTIKIPEGNDFTLYFPLVLLTDYDEQHELTASYLTDISVQVEHSGIKEDYEFTTEEHYIVVNFEDTLQRGTYNVHIRAKVFGRDIASHQKECFQIVAWNRDSNFKDFVFKRSQVVSTSVFIGNTVMGDAELEELKTLYRDMIAQLNQQGQELEEARARIDLTPIAKEQTVVNSKTEILDALGDMDVTAISDSEIQSLFE